MLRLMMALESSLSESQTSNLTLAQNEQSLFPPIFLIFFIASNLQYNLRNRKKNMSLKKMIKHVRLLQSLPLYLPKALCKQAFNGF